MNLKPCRDCGALVPENARGCPKCARNIEAEKRLGRFFWLAVVPVLLILSGVLVWLLYGRR